MLRPASPSRALAAATLAALSFCATAAQTDDGGPLSQRSVDTPADDLAASWRILRDPATPPADATLAADAIIAAAADPAVREDIRAALAPPLSIRGPGTLLLSAIARLSWPSPDLLPILEQRLQTAGPEELPSVLAALASFRVVSAAVSLLAYTNGGNPPPVTSAAFAALARLSGRDDIGPDRTAWVAWVDRARAMNPTEWDRELLRGLAARADRQSADRRDAAAHLTESLRKLHLKTPVEDRSALLADWLLDRLPEVRDLGLELVSRELADTGRLDAPVGEAALRLMSHPDPGVRASAAVLVRQLAPPGAAQAVLFALATETDPRAAAALLLAAARWPTSGVAPAVLTWLDRDTPALANAWEACHGLANAGVMDQAQKDHVLAILRRTDAAGRWPAACTLRADLGDDADRAALVPYLTAAPAPVRIAAAESLLWYPEFFDVLVAAARTNPDLFSVAARAALLHAPNAAAFAKVAALPSVTPQGARESLLLLARGLPAPDLLEATRSTTDPTLRAALLPLLTSENRVLSEGSVPANLRAIAEGIVMLAESDLERGDAAGALAALDGAPFLAEMIPADQVDPLRTAALVSLGRVNEADRTNSPLAAWLRGLELCRGAAHERAVASEILARFEDTITPEQRSLVEATRDRAAPDDATFVGPPSPPR